MQGYVPGQRVAVLNSRGGNWAEYACGARASRFCFRYLRRPKNEEVGSFVINRPHYRMVRHVLAVPRGEWLLQSAAGSDFSWFQSRRAAAR